MRKYHVVGRQSVYREGQFSHNVDRNLYMYARNESEIKHLFLTHCAKEGQKVEIPGMNLETYKEITAHIWDLGVVQHECRIVSMDEDGRMFTITNTVRFPEYLVAWQNRIMTAERERGRFIILCESKEVTIKDADDDVLPSY